MVKYLILFVILFLLFSFLSSQWLTKVISQYRRRSSKPEAENLTMFDVRRLLLDKEKELAIQVYQDIFKTTRQDAERSVEELERSIQAKNSD